MDFNKAQLFLDKISRELKRMKADPTEVAQIDVDILKNYIRELYDTCLDHNTPQQPVLEVRPQKVASGSGPKTISVNEEPRKAEPVHFTPERTTIIAKPEPIVEPAKKEEPAQPLVVAPIETPPIVVKPAPVVAAEVPPPTSEKPKPAEVAEVPPTPKVVSAQPTASMSVSRKVAALFDLPEAKEISEKLARAPISDVKKGMTLNDKLQWPKVLFGGDVAAFDEAINQINQAGTFENASAYLMEQFAERLDWANLQKSEVARAFILLVGRRFGK